MLWGETKNIFSTEAYVYSYQADRLIFAITGIDYCIFKKVLCTEILPVYPFNLLLAFDFKIAGQMCHLSLAPSQILVPLKTMN